MAKKAKAADGVVSGALTFAPSTFGQKKEIKPLSAERREAMVELHASLCDEDDEGNPILPSKTAFVVAANKAGFTTREIAELLEMKPAVVYSMIWRVTKGYKGPKKAKAVEEPAIEDEGEDELENDEDLEDELSDDDLGDEL